MKTSLKTLFAAACTAIILSSTAFSTFARDEIKNPSTTTTISGVNMVMVSGNVQVYLMQRDQEGIKVSGLQEEAVKVSIRQIGPKLFINSNQKEQVSVYVYVKDLKRIDASKLASVKTQGNFNLDVLQIFLHDHAKANINVVTGSLYTVIKGHSILKLSGSTGMHESVKDQLAKLKIDHFNAKKMQSITTETTFAFNKKIAGL